MNYLRSILPILIMFALGTAEVAGASTPHPGLPDLNFRTGNHPTYIRYVFEGPEEIISAGKVSKQKNDILVVFKGHQFNISGKEPLGHKGDLVVLTRGSDDGMKVFRLSGPSRLVIDLPRKDQKLSVKKKKEIGAALKNRPGVKGPGHENSAPEKVTDESRPDVRDNSESKVLNVPPRYNKLWTLLKSGNPYGVLSVLSEYAPESKEESAFYHYLYGASYGEAGKIMKAVEHLRLAHVQSPGSNLRERSLIKRAEVQLKGGFVYEALADYRLFLKEFPDSPRTEKAHLGLAECLVRAGKYRDAVRHYDKVTESADVLFSKANALQRIGKIRMADKIYKKALAIEPDYPDKAPETAYLIGENLRLSGDYTGAKKRFAGIITGRYKDEARISRGLIAMEDDDYDEAVRMFQTAVITRDRRIKVKALFNLSVAYARSGKTEKAVEMLEKIRTEHIDSLYYRDTLLALAKLYRRTGRVDKAVYLLKELVYGKRPPVQVFRELEEIVSDMARRKKPAAEAGISFKQLWREVGQWLVDRSREKFLLKVVKRLRHEGSPFIDLSNWMIKNTSPAIRTEAAVLLADYYIEIGDEELAEKYMTYTAAPYAPSDMARRVKARIYEAKKLYSEAVGTAGKIRKFRKDDMALLLRIIRETSKHGSRITDRAIALYEKQLGHSEWSAEEYIGIADILYAIGRGNHAAAYVQKAYKKNPDDEWITYRMAHDVEKNRSKEMFARLGSGDSLLGRLAKARIKEMNLLNKVSEVY